jgi:hypothetical protein
MKCTVELNELHETLVPPRSTSVVDGDALFVDFGKPVYGTITFVLAPGVETVVVHLGEKLDEDGRIDREPGATTSYRRIEQAVEPGQKHSVFWGPVYRSGIRNRPNDLHMSLRLAMVCSETDT